jgi:hypothetical protein
VGRRIPNSYSLRIRIYTPIADIIAETNLEPAVLDIFLKGAEQIVAGHSVYIHVRVL